MTDLLPAPYHATDDDIDVALDDPTTEARPWTIRVYVILGATVATSITAIVADYYGQTAVRSGAVVVAVLLGITLLPAVSRAEAEG